ncbi:MAG: site-2 protease family protein [Phototrophicaceae bacterium]|jgi:Zn-dependent protease
MLLLGINDPITFIIYLVVLVIAVTVHEFAHNYVAVLMGDPGPRRDGKLTLNPLAHISWQGFLMFIIIGFAPLGFAYINPRAMRDPRWGYFYAVAAGPFSNLLLAVIFAIPFQLLGFSGIDVPSNLFLFFRLGVTLNVILFVFNLLPLYPIDGWTILYTLLPADLAYTWERWKQYSTYVLFGSILIGFVNPRLNVIGQIIGGPVNAIIRLLLG